MADRRLTGLLLLGGASSRFGSPKALAPFDGELLADRCWRILGDACDERVAVGKAEDGLSLSFQVVDDGSPVRHPAAGLVAGLRAATTDVCVALPVDCPLITADALRALGAACADAAWPEGAGPLPGAYRRSALPALEECLAAQMSLRRAVGRLDVREVAIEPALLADVDTPGDLARLTAPREPGGDAL